MNTKDVYAGMAPTTYVRQLGSPRRAPIVARVRKKKRGKRRNEVELVRTAKINEALAYLESKYDPELAEVWDIYRTSIKDQRDASGDEACALCHAEIKHVYDVIDDDGYDLIVCLGCKAAESGYEAKWPKKTPSSTYPGLERVPGEQNWVDQVHGLPSLVERVAKHLHYEKGYTISHAIATAVNWNKKMCSTGTAFGGKVKVGARAQAAACRAAAEWEKKKGQAHATPNKKSLPEPDALLDSHPLVQMARGDWP